MKFLIVCLVAAVYAAPEAEAEADPALFYGGYGYPYAYGGYGLTYGLPAVHTVVKAAEADDAAVAEVKTVAAPAVTYAHAAYPYAHAAYHPYAYGGYAAGAYAGYPYVHAAYTGYPTVAATHVVAKRSADADADAYYGHYGYAGHHYGYAGHHYGYRGYGYGAPYTYGHRYGYGWGR
jgi:hypothetical protein